METWLATTGTEIIRIPAIDGSLLADDRLVEMTKSFGGRGLVGPREIACFLSHREAWKHASRQESRWIFVAEDDLHSAVDFTHFLQSDTWIPNDADLVKAETTFRKCQLGPAAEIANSTRSLHLLKSLHGGAGSYFISRDFAKRIVRQTESRWNFADFVLFDPQFHMRDNQPIIYQIDPAPTLQDIFLPFHGRIEESSLVPERKKNKPTSVWKKLGRELTRPVKRLSIGIMERIKAKLFGTFYRRVSYRDEGSDLWLHTGERFQ